MTTLAIEVVNGVEMLVVKDEVRNEVLPCPPVEKPDWVDELMDEEECADCPDREECVEFLRSQSVGRKMNGLLSVLTMLDGWWVVESGDNYEIRQSARGQRVKIWRV
jgi:hypothetical protein